VLPLARRNPKDNALAARGISAHSHSYANGADLLDGALGAVVRRIDQENDPSHESEGML
jgi:hypothetical protein